MKGLIIHKQHLDLILDGKKAWEMRSRATKIRGRIFLIEAGSGLIVGSADLVGCLKPLADRMEASDTWSFHRVDDLALLEKWNTPWVLDSVNRYRFPLRYNHPQGAVTWVNLTNDNILVARGESL